MEITSQTASDVILSGFNMNEENAREEDQRNLMTIPEKDGDYSKHTSLREVKKNSAIDSKAQSTKELSARVEVSESNGESRRTEEERKPINVTPSKVPFSKKQKMKKQREKKIKKKMIELQREYEKINEYIPSNTKKRLLEKQERSKARQQETAKNGKKKASAKIYKHRPVRRIPNPKRTSKSKSNKSKEKSTASKSAKSPAPLSANLPRADTRRTGEKKKGFTGLEYGDNYYDLMLEMHHNHLYSGPEKKKQDSILNQLKRFDETSKHVGIKKEHLTYQGKKKMGLDKKYEPSTLPTKRAKANRKGLSLNPSLKTGARRLPSGMQNRSKSTTNLNRETPKSAHPPRKVQNNFDPGIETINSKEIWRRYHLKARSLTPSSRNRESFHPRNINPRAGNLDQKVHLLIIQQRKIIQMKLELLRLENLIEREIKLKKIRNLDDGSSQRHNQHKILLKKFRETASRRLEETSKFLQSLGQFDWASHTEMINEVRQGIQTRGQIPEPLMQELVQFANELRHEQGLLQNKMQELQRKKKIVQG